MILECLEGVCILKVEVDDKERVGGIVGVDREGKNRLGGVVEVRFRSLEVGKR